MDAFEAGLGGGGGFHQAETPGQAAGPRKAQTGRVRERRLAGVGGVEGVRLSKPIFPG